MFIFTVALYLN